MNSFQRKYVQIQLKHIADDANLLFSKLEDVDITEKQFGELVSVQLDLQILVNRIVEQTEIA